MIIGFGYLGYSDQNRELAVTCLANSTSDVALRLNLTESEMESYGVKNVSRRFTFLFKSGFWILLAYLFLAIIWATCFRSKTRSAAVVKTLLSVVLVVQLGHFVTSNIFRFDHEGQVCSGSLVVIPINSTVDASESQNYYTSRLLFDGMNGIGAVNPDAC